MDELQILLSKAKNLVYAVDRGRPFAFTPFLNIEQQSEIKNFFLQNKVKCVTYGGYNDSERNVVAVYSESAPESFDFPFSPIGFPLSSKAEISHRDVLGSLMSLGIKRELIGDIIFFENLCVFFADNKIIEFILQNFVSVRTFSVKPEIYTGEINFARKYEELLRTVSSMRLDCIVSEITGTSRTRSSELILSGFVTVNASECLKKDRTLDVGDIISVRRKGKFKVQEDLGRSKKDKIRLKVLKYI